MYLVLHMPFVLLVVSSLQNNIDKLSSKRVMVIAFTFYAITQIGHVYGLIKRSNSEIILQHAQIVKKYHIDHSDKIIAPALFVFNEIANARISSTEMLNMLVTSGKLTLNSENLFNYANQHNFKYLVLDKNYLSDLLNSNLLINNLYYNYRLVRNDYGYYIFMQHNTMSINEH